MRRNQLTWGVILLLLGGLMLLNAMGIELPGGMSLMELFWPAILILAGIWVLLGVFVRGQIGVETTNVELLGAREADVRIDHGAGELKIHSGAGLGELARGTFAGGMDQKATRNGDRLEVRMRPARDVMDFALFGPRVRLDWDLALNAEIPLSLAISSGANKSMIDLMDLNVSDLKLETGASETKITLPSRGRLRADFDLGAASLEVVIPEGVSAKIRASVGIADLKVDESRFPRTGNLYQSSDFDSAIHTADITIDAGAASIKIL